MKIKFIFLTISMIAFLTSCQQSTQTAPSETNTAKVKKGMTKVTILYPNEEGKTFDMDYYADKHMPMLKNLFGDALKHLEIDKGIAGRTPDEPIPFLGIGYLYFDTLADYEKAFGPNAEKILGDIPNYTNIQPIVQISEVME